MNLFSSRISKILLGFAAVIFFLCGWFAFEFSSAYAQTSKEQERTQLEEELRALEEEIKQFEENVEATQAERKTLENQIAVLRNKIRKLDLQIAQSNKLIADLRYQIGDTEESIDRTVNTIELTREQLGDLLQRIYQEERKPTLEILLSGSELSDFFDTVMALETVNVKNRELLEQLQELTGTLNVQKENLQEEKSSEENFVRIQILQKQESQQVQAQQGQLLEVTKGQEAEYQKILTEKKEQAAEIRSRIFDLVGVPDAPTFGEAVEIAKIVSAQTGVRPAFLLAILTQESNIGKNVGQCYLADPQTGSGVIIYSGQRVNNVMKPSRDVQPFLAITKELGRDPYATPVSCPIPSVGGYGGAMGPAQFIPSTWNLYRSRLEALKGSPADPWNIKDAFLASALYVSDLGASKQTYNAEWCAAISYFSGRCNTKYRFYGDSVMALAARYESDIEAIE